MILEGAIGDVYGAGFEFADRAKIDAKNTITQYEKHPIFDSIYKKYTDDTQMSIALVELLIEEKEWTTLNIADKFVAAFTRDPREGYAKRFYKLLSEVNSGQELLDRIIPKSERNGAAMRAYPLGILKTETEVLEKTYLQTIVTHATEKAIKSAQAIALASHFLMYKKGNSYQLVEYLSDIQHYKWNANWSGEVEINAIQTVESVLTVLTQKDDLKGMLKMSVDFGGDVDTVASLALALGSLDEKNEKNLPQWLFDEMENDAFGRTYIEELETKFMKLLK